MNYKKELNQLINTANNCISYKETGFRIKVKDSQIVKFLIEIDIPISPRMSLKNLCNWLDGFISGLEF